MLRSLKYGGTQNLQRQVRDDKATSNQATTIRNPFDQARHLSKEAYCSIGLATYRQANQASQGLLYANA